MVDPVDNHNRLAHFFPLGFPQPELHPPLPSSMSAEPFQAPDVEIIASLLPAYDFDCFIAQGGMGAVYKARQRSLDRDVAIKILPRELGADPEFQQSFVTEAKAMARLNHPNLIGVYDFGDIDGMPYIVMEYVHGKSLYHSAYDQVIDPEQASTIVKGICNGLAHAHDNGVIHRDIKPANILLNPKAEPKIGDFGLAHPADAEGPGLLMGTPGYTAPEVFQDASQANERADIYSVGVILHQLLTGIDPTGSQTPPTTSCGNVRLDTIWRKATHINPALRYASAHELAAALDQWLAAKRLAPVTRLATSTAPPRHLATKVASKKSNRGIFGKIVLLALVGAGGWYAYQRHQDGNLNFAAIYAEATSAFKTFTSLQEKDPATRPPADTPPQTTSDPDSPDPENPSSPSPPPPPTETPAIDPSQASRIAPTHDPDEFFIPGPFMRRPGPAPLPAYNPGDAILFEKAIHIVSDLETKARNAIEENSAKLLGKLDLFERTANDDNLLLIKAIRDGVSDHRLPPASELPDLAPYPRLQQDHTRALQHQEFLESRRREELTKIRDAYVSRLQTSIQETEAVGGRAKLDLLKKQADDAADLETWVDLLTGS